MFLPLIVLDQPETRIRALDGDADLLVLVADDQSLLRGSFRVLIDTAPGLTTVGEAGTGAEAVESAHRLRPDVVLMDIRMPGMDGIEATWQTAGSPGTARTRVLILTTFDLDEYVYGALRAGAAGSSSRTPLPTSSWQASVQSPPESPFSPLGAPTPDRRVRPSSPCAPCDGLLAGGPHGARARSPGAYGTWPFPHRHLHLHVSNGTVKTYIGRLLNKLRARDRFLSRTNQRRQHPFLYDPQARTSSDDGAADLLTPVPAVRTGALMGYARVPTKGQSSRPM